MNIELPLLAIGAAEELERLRRNKSTNLNQTKKLSSIIKKDFTWRLDYSVIFSNAYFSTYNEKIPKLEEKNSTNYINDISNKLIDPSNLKEKELGELRDFCVNLSDHA